MYTDVMIDIETTGLNPDRNAMIQLAGVKFNLATGEVSQDFFFQSMEIPPHRFWDEGTRQWWYETTGKRDVLINQIYPRMRDPREVMTEFCQWAMADGQLAFWSKPTHFDWPFIQSYCKDYNMSMPFHYRMANDMNTFIRARYFPEERPVLDIPFQGSEHNALFDCLHQIQELFAHYQNSRTQIIPPQRDTPPWEPDQANVTDVVNA